MAEIKFHNKFNPLYRSVHIDGASGGVSPRGYLNLNFFAERNCVPLDTTVITDDKTGKIVSFKDSEDSKIGILREFEFGAYIDLKTAKELLAFLANKIQELEQVNFDINVSSDNK